jgi:cytochrome c-type biogenesis protein CcmH
MSGRALLLALALAAACAAPAAAQDAAAGTANVLDPQQAVGAPRGRPLEGAALDAQTQEIAALVRCPVCQGLSVADSPTDLARNMKRQIREMLAGGYDREQVLAYFESSYGEFVRLQPPLRGVNWLVWIAPALGLLAGAFVVARALRKPPPADAPRPVFAAPGDDPALEPYLLRVRELAYGWPGGRRPAPEAAEGPSS